MGVQIPPGSFLMTSSRSADKGTLAEWGSFQRRLTITIESVFLVTWRDYLTNSAWPRFLALSVPAHQLGQLLDCLRHGVGPRMPRIQSQIIFELLTRGKYWPGRDRDA